MVARFSHRRPLMSRKRIMPEEIPALLTALEEGDAATKRDILRRLCPCRSRCYEGEVWLAIFHTYHTSMDEAVCNQAEHAIETLREFSRTSVYAHDTVEWLAREHAITLPDKEPRRNTRKHPPRPLTSWDVPRLLEVLSGEDGEAQCAALKSLCPCRHRIYDKQVWLTIFRLHDYSDYPGVRDLASHAIDTLLRERTRIDPRSQDLVRWLRGRVRMPGHHSTPKFVRQPLPVASSGNEIELQIPVWERSQRSKTNRRRK